MSKGILLERFRWIEMLFNKEVWVLHDVKDKTCHKIHLDGTLVRRY